MRSLAAMPTFPTHEPCRQLDFVLVDDSSVQARRCSTPKLPVSDHRPLVIDVDGFKGPKSG
jgi:endonuclease/exonuclease/phosphatase family metal-dependent hydrolase